MAILAHSSTNWTIVNGTSTKITSDSGVTWTDSSSDIADMTGVSVISDADKTKAIVCDHNSNNVSISSDSGDNWASATTDPTNMTTITNVSFPTAGSAVLCGNPASGEPVYHTNDGGDNWTNTSTNITGGNVFVIDMIDGETGILVDDAQNIYTTDDGGITWTDSGQNTVAIPTSTQSSLIALTTTTGVLLNNIITTTVETFNTTSGGTARLSIPDAGEAQTYLSNLVKTTNGNLYFVHYTFSDAGDRGLNATLYRSTDSGVTWSQRALGANLFEVDTDLTTGNTKSQIIEYDTDKLLIMIGTQTLMKIDES